MPHLKVPLLVPLGLGAGAHGGQVGGGSGGRTKPCVSLELQVVGSSRDMRLNDGKLVSGGVVAGGKPYVNTTSTTTTRGDLTQLT